MKTASPIHLVVAVIVALALLAMAASVRAQSRGATALEAAYPHPNGSSVTSGRC